MIAETKGCSHAVDLTDTYPQIKTLLQFRLDSRTRRMRGLLTLFFEKCPCCSTQFNGMTMPSIFQRFLTMLSHGEPQPIGIRLADLHPSGCSSCLPRMALLHPSYQLGLRC